jgi:DNA helicase-2/ATP-dependent DNA helicase PcrA
VIKKVMKLEQKSFSKKQWDIITSKYPHKQVIAAAGSGKTRTVIGYTMYSLEQKSQNKILLLTFSRKACGEMMHRIPQEYSKHVEIRTFHAFCYHYIKNYHPEYSKYSFKILLEEEKNEIIKQILYQNPKKTYGIPYPVLINSIHHIQYKIPELYNILSEEIQKYKQENHYLEFEDLIEIVLDGLSKKQPWIEPLLQNYQHVVVDEFQDTDPKQIRFLQLLKPEKLLVVGDDWQAIYGFRGATIEPFFKFKALFQKSKIFKLDENYRSLEPIVKVGNFIISKSSKKSFKNVRAIRGNDLKIPVLGYYLGFFKNYDFIINLINQYNGMMLVRSNYRKRFWLNQGLKFENILTIHKSKGLEFSIVFIDITKGWSGENHLTDEEIRVLYVAITRAQNLCIILVNTEINSLESFIYKKLIKNQIMFVDDRLLLKYIEKENIYRNSLTKS